MECYAAYKAGRAEKDPSVNWYEGELGFFDFYIVSLLCSRVASLVLRTGVQTTDSYVLLF